MEEGGQRRQPLLPSFPPFRLCCCALLGCLLHLTKLPSSLSLQPWLYCNKTGPWPTFCVCFTSSRWGGMSCIVLSPFPSSLYQRGSLSPVPLGLMTSWRGAGEGCWPLRAPTPHTSQAAERIDCSEPRRAAARRLD